MTWHGLAVLLGLRYRLLWAQARLRRGKLALFLIGYLLACFLGATLMLGGYSAAMASVRLGKAELLARILLTGFSSIAVVAALVLGIGVNPAFSDAVLRRYPLSAGDRFLARRLTAFLDPLWMILLALFLGLAVGLYVVGAGGIWPGVTAALLLVVATCLFAQLLAGLIEWVAAMPAGPMILVVLAVAGTVALPAAAALLPFMKATPPFCAAALMAGGPPAGLLLLLAWCMALMAAIAGVERLPAPSQVVAGAPAEWDGPCDRLAARLGSAAPLVSKTLRYYWRTKRGRFGLLVNGPVLPFLLLMMAPDRRAPLLHFFIGVGLMAVAGFAATFAVAVNSFGFDGPGFRRYFLLPVPAAAVIRAASLVPLAIGALALPVVFAACLLLSRVPVDARMAAMLAANGVGGLCFFHALALWTSILAPSRTDGEVRFGNDYSLAANLAGNGGMLAGLFGSQFLGLAAGARVLEFWWVAPVFMAAAAVFYLTTLRAAPEVLLRRREQILAVVEREQGGSRLRL